MEITIPKRFCGPATSGNGGYSSGRLAAFVEGPAEVTLRMPPPLDTPLRVVKENSSAILQHGGQLIAEARPASDFTLDVPSPPGWEAAQIAAKGYAGHKHHDYGSCFVCGPQRKPGDGLCIFCGPWKDGVVAGPWQPDSSLGDSQGRVKPEFLWAAIDCPGSWSVIGVAGPQGAPSSSMLLGRLTGRLLRDVHIGEDCIVIGWPLDRDGRKYHVGSAVYTRTGELAAYSRGTWIALKS
jgi:hypothetical protein